MAPFFGIALCGVALAGCATFRAQPVSPEQTRDQFNNRSLGDASLCRFLGTNQVSVPGKNETWDLRALTLVAFFYEPGLAEAREQLAAIQAAQITAGERPNPSVSVTPGYDIGIPGNPSPWLVTLTSDWPIETGGKRRKRMAQASHLAEAARWDLVGAIWQARSRVRAALVDLYAAGENESFLSRQLAAQSNVVRLLKDQFEAGAVSGYELTQARVTADSTRLAWQEAVGLRGEALAQMAATLGLPLDALDGAKFSFAVFDQFSTELTRPEARRRALLNRADVRGALADYAASQSALQLEIAKQYPDLHLGPGYAWNAGSAGDNEWNLGLTLTLPIMNHNQGAVAEAKARRAQAAAHFRTVQANAIAGINSAMAAYDAAMQLWSTARTLRENLRRRLNSVQELEQAGEAEPLTVANAQVEFGVSSQSQLAALIKTQRALGQLEDAVQSPLTLPPGLLRAAEKNPIR